MPVLSPLDTLAVPLAEMKSVKLPTSVWTGITPEIIAYVLFAVLILIILYVFNR